MKDQSIDFSKSFTHFIAMFVCLCYFRIFIFAACVMVGFVFKVQNRGGGKVSDV